MKKRIVPFALISLFLLACESTELPEAREARLELPATPYAYETGMNDNIPTLGRVLFYDRRMSVNNSVSCSSCHKQELAFADNKRFSVGFGSKVTSRNSMPIQNLQGFLMFANMKELGDSVIFTDPINILPGSEGHLFWDGREKGLDEMVLRPLVNHVEMGITDMDVLAKKLSEVPYYEELFTKAYGESTITSKRIADALSWFLRSIRSDKTKLDMHVFDSLKQFQLTPQEMDGQRLFVVKYDCNSCHQVQNPIGYQFAGTFANIGLEEQYADNGVQNVTKNSADAGRFKIPSLRNVALTAPYMHDGRFATLEDVVDHYKDGIQSHHNLDHRLRNKDGSPKHFPITESEKKSIIAFLKTLTDENMIRDPRFSDPFKLQ